MSREAYPDLIKALSDFSMTQFTEYQAAAYVALIEMGEESGSAVASQAGINRSKIYDVLNDLEKMGAVKKVSRDKKTRYIAVPPGDFLPKLIEEFRNGIEQAKESLKDLQNLQEEIDPIKFTLTTLDVDEIDTNKFEYMISTNETVRVKFTEKLPKDNRPGIQVKILNLNDRIPKRGLVLLLNQEECYLFGTPTGKKADSIHIISNEICQFIIDLVESAWTNDLPIAVIDEIERGQRMALTIEKALSAQYDFFPQNQEYRYERPLSVLISDEHISFFYEETEELKIPIMTLDSVRIIDKNFIRVIFKNTQGEEIGDLRMKIVGNPHYLKNIMEMAASSYK